MRTEKRWGLWGRVLITGITLLWMCLIFGMSAKDSGESSGISAQVCEVVAEVTVPDYRQKPPQVKERIIDSLQFAVRKCAHFTEYAVLGILMMTTLLAWGVPAGRLWWMALLLCALYAGTDEAHQLFVPGRSAQLRDVCIDSAGSAAGIALLRAIRHFYQKSRKTSDSSPFDIPQGSS